MSLYDANLEIFEILVNQNYKKVYQTVYSYTEDKCISEDAIQQAFVIAYTKLYQLKIKDKFTSWVISIALKTSIPFMLATPSYLPHESNIRRVLLSSLGADVYQISIEYNLNDNVFVFSQQNALMELRADHCMIRMIPL